MLYISVRYYDNIRDSDSQEQVCEGMHVTDHLRTAAGQSQAGSTEVIRQADACYSTTTFNTTRLTHRQGW